MINTLSVATDGLIKNRTPLSIATLGLINIPAISGFIDNNLLVWDLNSKNIYWNLKFSDSSWNIKNQKTYWVVPNDDDDK